MPIYEFTCSKCGCDFEDLVPNRGDSSPCPKCKSKIVTRRISVPAPHVSKGSVNVPSCSDGSCHTSCGCSDEFCSHN